MRSIESRLQKLEDQAAHLDPRRLEALAEKLEAALLVMDRRTCPTMEPEPVDREVLVQRLQAADALSRASSKGA